MNPLAELKREWESLSERFEQIIAVEFPGATKYDWYRALSHIRGEPGRRNDDMSRDIPMAVHAGIKSAHDDYIAALHRFYRARDGEDGVLGGRGL